MGHFGSAIALSQHLKKLCQHLQTLPSHQIGYGGGNLLNLFRHLKTDLTGHDFSGLTLRQAILHDVSLRRTNFTQATFRQCSFANTFGGITNLAFSPDGNRFATCDSNGNVALWSVMGMHPTAKCIGHDFWTWAVTFSLNSALLASCGQDQTIRLWDTTTGHCHKILQGHTNIVTDVTFSTDGSSLLSCSTDGIVKLWNLATGNCVQTFVGHEKCVWGVVFAPDGQHCYSGGEDNYIRYWDLHTGACLKVFTGHTQWIMAIALSPDGLQLASASMDGTIKLWCTATANCLHTLSGHQAPVLSVAFSPNGRTLASGSYDQAVRLWNTRSGGSSKNIPTAFGASNFIPTAISSPAVAMTTLPVSGTLPQATLSTRFRVTAMAFMQFHCTPTAPSLPAPMKIKPFVFGRCRSSRQQTKAPWSHSKLCEDTKTGYWRSPLAPTATPSSVAASTAPLNSGTQRRTNAASPSKATKAGSGMLPFIPIATPLPAPAMIAPLNCGISKQVTVPIPSKAMSVQPFPLPLAPMGNGWLPAAMNKC